MYRHLARVFLLSLLIALPSLHAQRELLTPDQIEQVEKKWPGTKRTATGIRYIVLKEGTGESPKSGDRVNVLYIGSLLDGTEFDRTQDPSRPFTFRVDRGEVITGWDQIIKTMKVGEKRIVIIPSSLGYGSRGQAPKIPRDAVLVFEMELISQGSE